MTRETKTTCSLRSGQALRYDSGQAALMAVLFFLATMLAVTFGFTSLALNQEKVVRTNLNGKQSYYVAEGVHEDVVYRLMNGAAVDLEEVVELLGHAATTTRTTASGNQIVTSRGDVHGNIRTVETELETSGGVAFSYGIQSGEGGILMENLSEVLGNAYSNGPITGDGNDINGDVISAGPAGLIDDIHATGTAYAHTIQNSLVEGDAHYQVISATTVLGTEFPDAEDQATSSLPISDQQIADWEAEAEAGGIISSPCPYKIDDDEAIGPVKITCDLSIEKNGTEVDLGGPVWVEGNIDVKNSVTVRVSSSLDGQSIPVIADNPSDRLAESKITLQNNSLFEGAGNNSYILFVSQNESAESGGSEVAIDIKNNATGDLLIYAGHGEILLQNNNTIREVSAYRIHTKNNAVVEYESGLANLLFTSGPTGGYDILDWREIE